MKDPHLQGQISRAQGAMFEKYISRSCDFYLANKTAKIEKTPEPMKPISGSNGKGQFLACYTKQAQPDYKGVIKGGNAVIFEAKHTTGDRIEYNRLTKEQVESLEEYYRLGAAAFVLVSFSMLEFYRIPWEVWRTMKELYGRKYLRRDELLQYRVPFFGGVIHFLEGLSWEI